VTRVDPRATRPLHASPRLAVGLAATLIALARPADVIAQLVPCSGVSEPGFKVLVDDIVADGAAGPSPLMFPLVHRLDANLEQLRLETGLALKIVRCAKRRPSDPSDFRQDLVGQLNARQVVLEIWGTMARVTDASGESFHEASIGYVLVPVRHYEFGRPEPPGAFLVPRRADEVASIDALVRLVDQSGRVAAYAALGAGTRLLRAKEYLPARTQLCRAELLLRALAPKPRSPDAALMAYAQRLAGEAVREARAGGSPAMRDLFPPQLEKGCAGGS